MPDATSRSPAEKAPAAPAPRDTQVRRVKGEGVPGSNTALGWQEKRVHMCIREGASWRDAMTEKEESCPLEIGAPGGPALDTTSHMSSQAFIRRGRACPPCPPATSIQQRLLCTEDAVEPRNPFLSVSFPISTFSLRLVCVPDPKRLLRYKKPELLGSM